MLIDFASINGVATFSIRIWILLPSGTPLTVSIDVTFAFPTISIWETSPELKLNNLNVFSYWNDFTTINKIIKLPNAEENVIEKVIESKLFVISSTWVKFGKRFGMSSRAFWISCSVAWTDNGTFNNYPFNYFF